MGSRKYALLLSTIIAIASASVAGEGPPRIQLITLPGAPAGSVFMDYLAYDRGRHRLWVPAGNTGNVYVLDVTSGRISQIDGFPTAEIERQGRKRTVGPSSATVGEGVVYVGNRGDSSVCAVEAESLRKDACIKLEAMPDGLAYVRSAKEVWVTTPRDKSITVLDASTPAALTAKTRITLEGQPEGFAVDDSRGVFYTNLEDKDRTLTIEIKSRHVTRTWQPGCGADGPKGLALDHTRDFLFVACSDRVKVLDAGHGGKELSAIDTGDGVDNIDYLEARHELYVGAARAAKLTVARVDSHGKLRPEAAVATAAGARNAVVTDEGVAYLTDSPDGKIVAVSASRR